MEMVDPHNGMVSFQRALRLGVVKIGAVEGFRDLYSCIDEPTPGELRLTYIRLSSDRRTVMAFATCIMNGNINNNPCVSIGYAVPEKLRDSGHAKTIFLDVIRDQLLQAQRAGHKYVYFEAVMDVANYASQRVAGAVLGGTPESIIDAVSGRPAYRYATKFCTTSTV